MATQKGEELLYKDLTYKVRGACFKIWKEFGSAFKESVIVNALVKELRSLGLKVEINKKINIYYQNTKVGIYIPDLIINGLILIEVKRKPYLTKQDEQQFWYYLKCTNYRLGFLINFGDRKLEIKRRIFDKARQNYPRKSAYLSAKFPLREIGFTITEILVSVSIFVILTVILLANFRGFEKESELETGVEELATILRQVQIWALIGQTSGGLRPAGGWGVYVDEAGGRYLIFADGDSCEHYESGEEYQNFDLPSSLSISSDHDHIAFAFPKAQVFIEAYCSPAGSCINGDCGSGNTLESFDDVTITLTHQATGKTKQITVNKTSGQINIQ